MSGLNEANPLIEDDILICMETYLKEHTTASTWNPDDWSLFQNIFDETNQSNTFVESLPTNLLESIHDSDVTEPPLIDFSYDELIDLLATIPSSHTSVSNNPPSVKEPSSKSLIVKSSDENETITFINSLGYVYTNGSLQLTIPPLNFQRARRESELQEVLRYIFVPNDATMTLTVSDLLSHIVPQMSSYLRITRLTKPFGTDQLVFYHPYPLWLKDQNSRVYHNSLFLSISGRSITIEKLAFERMLQNVLEKCKQFPIFTATQLTFAGFHSINAGKKKDIIRQYELRYSILHFQVCVVDKDNHIYPTDLQCQSEPIYEYEAHEGSNLLSYAQQMGNQSNKRKDIGRLNKSSKKTKKFEHEACG